MNSLVEYRGSFKVLIAFGTSVRILFTVPTIVVFLLFSELVSFTEVKNLSQVMFRPSLRNGSVSFVTTYSVSD